MTQGQSALSAAGTPRRSSLAHEEVFRRLLRAGLQDLIDAEAEPVNVFV
jgi:hypothetical protein